SIISPNSSSTIRPPPRSTLFPYTTLFRSVESAKRSPQQSEAIAQHYLSLAPGLQSMRQKLAELQKQLAALKPITVPIQREMPMGDRKSTRLNSSHSQISYAVFCLKKKNDK